MSDATTPKSIPFPLVLAAGGAMGAADAVPGVSGGTIALIVGVYERLLESLSHVLATPRRIRTAEGRAQLGVSLQFLVPLGVGVIAAWWLGTRLLVGPTDEPGLIRRLPTAPLCYAFFFGLVLVSVREPWRRIKTPRVQMWVALVLGAALAAWFAGLPHNQGVTHDWMLLYGGALAIAVMLLPGISGSLLLLILGQYTAVASAVHDLALGRIGIFVLGLALGAATFVPLLRALLRRHHDVTLARPHGADARLATRPVALQGAVRTEGRPHGEHRAVRRDLAGAARPGGGRSYRLGSGPAGSAHRTRPGRPPELTCGNWWQPPARVGT